MTRHVILAVDDYVHACPRLPTRFGGFLVSGVGMPFLGRPDPLQDPALVDRYRNEIRKRMAEHHALRARLTEPGHRNEVRKKRAELHVEIDILLDMIAVARIVG